MKWVENTISYITTMNNNNNNKSDGNYYIHGIMDYFRNDCNDTLIPININKSASIDLSQSYFMLGCLEAPTNNSSTALYIKAEGENGPFSYSIYDSENNLITVTSDSTINNLNNFNSFKLYATDACGSTVIHTVNNKMSGPFTLASSLGIMPCYGNDIKLTGPYIETATYQWFKDNSLISGQNTNELTLLNIDPTMEGNYQLAIENVGCTVTSNSFIVDNAQCGTPLNLNLLSFNAINSHYSINLKWTVSNVEENHVYQLQKSNNSTQWNTIYDKSADEILNNVSTYDYSDYEFLAKQYYRLRIQSLNGDILYSQILTVERNLEHKIFIAPNPSSSNYTTIFNAKGSQLSIFSVEGKYLHSVSVNADEYKLDISMLKAGIYILKFDNSPEIIKLNVLK